MRRQFSSNFFFFVLSISFSFIFPFNSEKKSDSEYEEKCCVDEDAIVKLILMQGRLF